MKGAGFPYQGQHIAKEEWSDRYPASDFPSSPRGLLFPLHYFLALDKPRDKICELISSTQKIEKLTLADRECFLLTPCHLAAMMAEKAVADALILRLPKEHLEEKDAFGWTPLFHAYVESPDHIFEKLKQKGCSLQTVTAMGGTLVDIAQLIGRIPFDIGKSAMSLISSKGSQPLSVRDFKQMTGVEIYTDTPIFLNIGYLWKQSRRNEKDPTIEARARAYQVWRQRPTQVALRDCPELKSLTERHLELCAGEAIATGQVIGEVGGEISRESEPYTSLQAVLRGELQRSDPYLLNFVSAKRAGNVLREVNVGFPNTFLANVYTNGSRRLIAMASEPIAAGTPILIDSNSGSGDYLAYHVQVLFRREDMRAYFTEKTFRGRYEEMVSQFESFDQRFAEKKIVINLSKKGPPQLSKKAQDRVTSNNDSFLADTDGKLAKILFCFRNPGALLDLIHSHTTPAEEFAAVIGLFLKNRHLLTLFMSEMGHLCWMEAFVKQIALYDITFQKYPVLRDKIDTWVTTSIGVLPNMTIFKGLHFLHTSLSQPDVDVVSVGQLCDSLTKRYENFDWLNDPAPPLPLDTPWQDWIQKSSLGGSVQFIQG